MPRRLSRSPWSPAAAAAVVVLALVGPAAAQQEQGGGLLAQAVREKLEAVKQSAAANKAALQHYAWTENIQVALNGEVKTTKQMSCRYGPDGKPQCQPLGPPPPQEQQRGLRGRIAEKKKEEFTDYIQQVKGVIGLYVPPDSARMQAAHAAGNVSFSRPASGEAGLVFRNYSLPGDSMTLDFAMATKKLAALAVSTYLGDPSSPVTLNVQFAILPDGTSYPAQEVVNAAAKGIQLTVTNSNYQKLAN
ncbi:MAG TPA: hypothetical protein VMN82_17370 [Thermoanaerobaculia bacterium]|nr:hypothetical protein [Thermoanaerobaculia bacterium]